MNHIVHSSIARHQRRTTTFVANPGADTTTLGDLLLRTLAKSISPRQRNAGAIYQFLLGWPA
jgi:hypothetical protein